MLAASQPYYKTMNDWELSSRGEGFSDIVEEVRRVDTEWVVRG